MDGVGIACSPWTLKWRVPCTLYILIHSFRAQVKFCFLQELSLNSLALLLISSELHSIMFEMDVNPRNASQVGDTALFHPIFKTAL